MVKVTDQDYYMDGYLQRNLDVLVKHIKKDWFFMILISGSGNVRVGKSVLAGQVAYYLSHKNGLKFTTNEYYMSGEEMMEKAINLPKNSAFVYDEAKGGLDSKRAMESITKNLLDFFAEAGQLNLIPIIVLPDFFDLKKEIAVTQSICLLNVYYSGEFERGYYSFFSSERKKELYFKGKYFRSYFAAKPDFRGRFSNHYVVDEGEYRKKKFDSLKQAVVKRVEQEKPKEVSKRYRRWFNQRNHSWFYIKEKGLNLSEFARFMEDNKQEITYDMIMKVIKALENRENPTEL